jgi:hypothetical protein
MKSCGLGDGFTVFWVLCIFDEVYQILKIVFKLKIILFLAAIKVGFNFGKFDKLFESQVLEARRKF